MFSILHLCIAHPECIQWCLGSCILNTVYIIKTLRGIYVLLLQVAELASLAQLLPPCSPTVRNPAPDSSLKSCFSPIASASAAARRLRLLQLLLAGTIAASASTAAPRLPPPPAAAPRLRPLQLLLAAFTISCCSRLRPLQLLLARLRPLRLLLPDCILDSSPCPGPNGNVLEHSSRSSRFSK